MLVKFKTWISERISSIIFLPLIFLLSLTGDNLFWLFAFILITFLYIWYRKGNLWQAIFFAFFFLPVWYVSFLLLPFRKLIWSLMLITFLLLFLEEKLIGELIVLEVFTLSPLLFFINHIFSLEITLILISTASILAFLLLYRSLFLGFLVSVFLLEINMLFLLFPYFSIWRLIIPTTLTLFLFTYSRTLLLLK